MIRIGSLPVATLFVALASAITVACSTPDENSGPEASALAQAAANKETMRRFVDAMNARDFDALDEFVSPDVVRESPSTPGVVVRSLDQFKDYLRQDLEGVPDAVQEIRMMVAEGDRVAVWANYSGTQIGPMGGFPATGGRVDLDFAGILRFEEGKIAEINVVWDNLGMLVQLGHLEPPGSGQ
jgi:steroid delta-isomerase-like uncharacterized protein